MNVTSRRTIPGWSRRPHFAPRQKLTAHALNAALDDQLARQALLARALHGSGVVFGLTVEAAPHGALTLGCGLALDRHGRMLFREESMLAIEDLAGAPPKCAGDHTLVMHYAERHEPQRDWEPCGDEPEWVEQGVVFTLRAGCTPIERCCAERPPRDQTVEFDDYVCQRTGAHEGPVARSPDLAWACADPGMLCTTHCGWRYDAQAGIDIACVAVVDRRGGHGECGPLWAFGEPVDPCAVRPFVARTPLLMDLIRGCPPQIESISWQDWTEDYDKPVRWRDFATALKPGGEGLRIRFTKPIRRSALHPGSITLGVVTRDHDTDYLVPQQIPLDPKQPIRFLDEQGDYTSSIKLNLYRHWVDNQLGGNRGLLFDFGGQIEVTIRGQLLRDSCEAMLDARIRNATPVDWGNRRIGADFVSVFRVAPARQPQQRIEYSADEDSDDDNPAGSARDAATSDGE
jgi:hypothetical protein